MRRRDPPARDTTRSCEITMCGASAPGAKARGARRRPALWRLAAAEFTGTAALLLLTCTPALCAPPGAAAAPLLQRALATGLLVTLIVQCFDHISGAQLNPTVTLARALSRYETAARALGLVAAQLAGALAGAGAAAALAHPARVAPASACLTLPAAHVSPLQAVAVEAVLGAWLALANLAAWDARNRALLDSWPLRAGLSVAALTLAAGDVTGASMNPARSFATALLAARWEHHWVYWVGPLSGSCASAALYACVWRAPARAPARGLFPAPSPPAPPSPPATPAPPSPATPHDCGPTAAPALVTSLSS